MRCPPLLMLAITASLAGCFGAESQNNDSPDGDLFEETADVHTEPDDALHPCPAGQVVGVNGQCVAVGIQGCDDMFINPETGLCEPSDEHCPPGQIAIFSGDDQGCHPVGILGCDDMFINPETGLCEPSDEHCPP